MKGKFMKTVFGFLGVLLISVAAGAAPSTAVEEFKVLQAQYCKGVLAQMGAQNQQLVMAMGQIVDKEEREAAYKTSVSTFQLTAIVKNACEVLIEEKITP